MVNSISVTEGWALRSYDWSIFTFLRSDWLWRNPNDIWACGFLFFSVVSREFLRHHASCITGVMSAVRVSRDFHGRQIGSVTPQLSAISRCAKYPGGNVTDHFIEKPPPAWSAASIIGYTQKIILKVTTISYFLR